MLITNQKDAEIIERYVEVRSNTRKIKCASELIKSVLMSNSNYEQKKVVREGIEKLRQINHAEFNELSDKIYFN